MPASIILALGLSFAQVLSGKLERFRSPTVRPRGTMVTLSGSLLVFMAGGLVRCVAAFLAYLQHSDPGPQGQALWHLMSGVSLTGAVSACAHGLAMRRVGRLLGRPVAWAEPWALGFLVSLSIEATGLLSLAEQAGGFGGRLGVLLAELLDPSTIWSLLVPVVLSLAGPALGLLFLVRATLSGASRPRRARWRRVVVLGVLGAAFWTGVATLLALATAAPAAGVVAPASELRERRDCALARGRWTWARPWECTVAVTRRGYVIERGLERGSTVVLLGEDGAVRAARPPPHDEIVGLITTGPGGTTLVGWTTASGGGLPEYQLQLLGPELAPVAEPVRMTRTHWVDDLQDSDLERAARVFSPGRWARAEARLGIVATLLALLLVAGLLSLVWALCRGRLALTLRRGLAHPRVVCGRLQPGASDGAVHLETGTGELIPVSLEGTRTVGFAEWPPRGPCVVVGDLETVAAGPFRTGARQLRGRSVILHGDLAEARAHAAEPVASALRAGLLVCLVVGAGPIAMAAAILA